MAGFRLSVIHLKSAIYQGTQLGWIHHSRNFSYVSVCKQAILQPNQTFDKQLRSKSSLEGFKGDELWKSVYGISASGKKRGRGRAIKKIRKIDLNVGKVLGEGPARMKYPGLNYNEFEKNRDTGEIRMHQLHKDKTPATGELDLNERRRENKKPPPVRAPLLRGWTGRTVKGTKLGPPLPVSGCDFKGFETYVLEFRAVQHMTGTIGAKRSMSAFVVTGNRNGLVGLGRGQSLTGPAALRMAKKKASQHLVYVPRFEDHTVYHNMYSQVHRTKLFIYKKQKGYGLAVHRVIKCVCDLAGIQNLYAKVEGSQDNNILVAKAFVNALAHQETHQELADRTKLHVVEYRKERSNLPVVVASPEGGVATGEPLNNEEEDITNEFGRYYMRGKVHWLRPPPRPRFYRQQAYKKKLNMTHKRRNMWYSCRLRKAELW